VALNVTTCVARWKSGIFQYEVDNFYKYKSSFDVVASTLRKQFKERLSTEENAKIVTMVLTNECWELLCEADSVESFRCQYTPSEKDINALSEVNKAFSSEACGGLMTINVTKNQITFLSSHGYAVVKAENGTSPKNIFGDGNDIKFYCQRLSLKWYHAGR